MTNLGETGYLAMQFTEAHIDDVSWVASAARSHGCRVLTKNTDDLSRVGHYNLHVPGGSGGVRERDLNRILFSSGVVYACMDRRQVAQVHSEVGISTTFLTSAGGAFQERQDRFDVDVAFLSHLAREMSNPEIRLMVHSDTCGGASVMMGADVIKVWRAVGCEDQQMLARATTMASAIALNSAGRLSLGNIAIGLVRVQDDVYQGISYQ